MYILNSLVTIKKLFTEIDMKQTTVTRIIYVYEKFVIKNMYTIIIHVIPQYSVYIFCTFVSYKQGFPCFRSFFIISLLQKSR